MESLKVRVFSRLQERKVIFLWRAGKDDVRGCSGGLAGSEVYKVLP
jgi:hypothetical protein